MRVCFGEHVLDSATRELQRGERNVHLSPKAFQLLELLLESRPRALSKAEIRDSLWPATFVSDSNLARLVAELRDAIGDDRRLPRYVRTVYGFGYAFSGEAKIDEAVPRAVSSIPACRIVWGRREIPLAEGENILGRAEDAAIRIDSTKVSRRHARILVRNGGAMLEDLGSKNGTCLRGERLRGPAELCDGDEISLGPVALTYRAVRGSSSTETDSTR